MEEEDGWTAARARRGAHYTRRGEHRTRQWDAATTRFGPERSRTTTFFMTEFGEEWRARDLYQKFKEFGDLDEVIIASKRDKRGRRFGFIRFFNVTDERLMATKLDNLFLHGRKLHVNIPKFIRKEKEAESVQRNHHVKGRLRGEGQNRFTTEKGGTSAVFGEGVHRNHARSSYAEVLKKGGSEYNPTPHKVFLNYDASEEELHRFKKAYVGEV
ncbi:uncharacterized protein LOC131634287 [Vicia villosa]|uniref:uncharacterized protein LOC131634287 n=1 Tax=Vicia villosa TaxID=3911 RepID=UPI00273AC7B9|nr:uncharacterized protein LOC131634287 [Vicia villosa]